MVAELPDPTLSDEALMLLVQQKNEAAFAALVHRHSRRFYAVAFRTVFYKHEAEDIVQEAFVKLWLKPELWDSKHHARFTTWFYRVVINLCLDYHKGKKAEPMPEFFEVQDSGKDALAQLEDQRQKTMVQKALQQLPERQRIALNLCFYEELSNQEAANIMAIPLKALQSLLMRAKTNLKETLREGRNGR